MELIRVLIIDDSVFMRKMITDILINDPRIDVIGTARNGKDGLNKIKSLSPDVVTLDVEMPVMDGLITLEKIVENYPIPVVMLSSVTEKGTAQVVQSIEMGAVDFIEKPSGAISLDIKEIKDEIVKKVVIASEARVSKGKVMQREIVNIDRKQIYDETVIAIGTSTGGPRALQQVLLDFRSKNMPPIFIVQHMPPKFTTSLASRLNSMGILRVKEAVHGEIAKNNTAYIAPGDFHMEIFRNSGNITIELNKKPLVRSHRPSVDVLFKSVANLKSINKIAIVLTGMGRDGAKGIKEVKKKDPKAVTIAESKESTIINGMPAAAIKTNSIDQIIHLHKIGEAVTNIIN